MPTVAVRFRNVSLAFGRVRALDGSVLGKWRRKRLDDLDGGAAPIEGMTPSELAAENDRLRRENSKLAEQRDILKKALNIIGEEPRR
jgi:transposase-like protein